MIGLEVNGQPIAPRLTALARESLYLANNYEPTHLGSTADAEFAVMQSLYPLPVGVVASRYARNQYRGLPALLAERGYNTFAAVGALPHFWNMNQLHPRYGFQHAYYEDSFQIDERIIAWISDREFWGQMQPILQREREPYMAFMLSSSSHHPYTIPEQYKTLKLGALEGTMVGDYLHSIHYADQELGAFVDGLRESGILDRSMLVIYGDHQGFLGGQSELPALLGFSDWNEYHHFRVVKRTPVLIRLPGGAAAGEYTGTSSHLDVAPTVLSLLGIDDRSTVMLGRDLTRPGRAAGRLPGRQLRGRLALLRQPFRTSRGVALLRGGDRRAHRLRAAGSDPTGSARAPGALGFDRPGRPDPAPGGRPNDSQPVALAHPITGVLQLPYWRTCIDLMRAILGTWLGGSLASLCVPRTAVGEFGGSESA